MKKVWLAAFVIIIAISAAGCSLFNGNDITEVTLPASLTKDSGMSPQSDLSEYVAENGFESVEWNDDGSLTIKLTNKRKAEMIKVMEEGLLNSFNRMMNTRDTYYIRSIDASDDYRTITIGVYKEAYENSFEPTSYTVGMSAAFFQAYAGEEAYVDVVVVDVDTGAQIDFSHYPIEE